jgi:hypothetical protein
MVDTSVSATYLLVVGCVVLTLFALLLILAAINAVVYCLYIPEKARTIVKNDPRVGLGGSTYTL